MFHKIESVTAKDNLIIEVVFDDKRIIQYDIKNIIK